MKYKVGDRVKVSKNLMHCGLYGGTYFFGDMDKYEGKIVTINGIDELGKYRIKEDNGEWAWTDRMFESIMTNFDKVKEEIKLDDVGVGENAFCKAIHRIKEEMHCGTRRCKECREWLKQPYVEKKEILDKAEKEYLSAVIKPFRGRVAYVKKYVWGIEEQRIYIRIKNSDTSMLPPFKKNTMYTGMENGKEYKLEELGL